MSPLRVARSWSSCTTKFRQNYTTKRLYKIETRYKAVHMHMYASMFIMIILLKQLNVLYWTTCKTVDAIHSRTGSFGFETIYTEQSFINYNQNVKVHVAHSWLDQFQGQDISFWPNRTTYNSAQKPTNENHTEDPTQSVKCTQCSTSCFYGCIWRVWKIVIASSGNS